MTLPQWHCLRSGGGPDREYEPLPADPELEERVVDARAAFWADAPATETETSEAAP